MTLEEIDIYCRLDSEIDSWVDSKIYEHLDTLGLEYETVVNRRWEMCVGCIVIDYDLDYRDDEGKWHFEECHFVYNYEDMVC